MTGKELHRYAYDVLMNYMQQHPEFTFWFRQKRADRFKQGYIFQGNENYAFVGLYNRSGGTNMTRSIGIVFYPATDGSVGIKLENVFNEEKDETVLSFYEEMRNKIEGFQQTANTKFQKIFKNPTDELNNFLLTQKPEIDALVKVKGLDNFFITEENFNKSLQKITPYLNNQNTAIVTSNTIMKKIPLNTILYGPPGTGKTYNTINTALEILGVNIDNKSRKEIKEEFDKRLQAGEVVFTTFHQSMSYEDFIEGIKPKTTSNNSVVYEVEDGIFKRICNAARFIAGNFETVLEKFKQDVSEEDGKTPITITAIATSFDVKYTGTNIFYVQPHNSTKENAWYPVNINNIRKAFETENYQGLYNPTYIREILKYLTEKYGLKKSNNNNQDQKNYVLIIDEINRGNVSQIFGELITLIEEDKRQGNNEAIAITLPYSKEEFSVPANLYILGTMNTADRSVEALDTALRRRFMFEEMMPQAEIIQQEFEKHFLSKCVLHHHLKWEDDEWQEIEAGYTDFINEIEFELFKHSIRDNYKSTMTFEEYYSFWLKQNMKIKTVNILQTLNERIGLLLNRDNLIGHAFFIEKYTWAALQTVFHKNIIPLLQEYFYGDYGKIGLVIGEGFFNTILEEQKQNTFAKFGSYETAAFLDKPKYELKDISKMKEEDFIDAIQKLLNEQ